MFITVVNLVHAKNKESRQKAYKLSTVNKTPHPSLYADLEIIEHENRPDGSYQNSGETKQIASNRPNIPSETHNNMYSLSSPNKITTESVSKRVNVIVIILLKNAFHANISVEYYVIPMDILLPLYQQSY